jgi:hypothetical protein
VCVSCRVCGVKVCDFDAGVNRLSFQFREPRKHGFYNGTYSVAMPPPYFGLSRHKADYNRNRTPRPPTFAFPPPNHFVKRI